MQRKGTFHNFFEQVKLNKKSQFHLKSKKVFPIITLKNGFGPYEHCLLCSIKL